MDLKALLEKFDQFAGQAVGQKPGDQWKGKDKGTPGKKLVGASESVLKDLSKGPTPKTREQELAEEWAMFNEEDFGTHPKRPGRPSDRPHRGHEPQPRYKTIKNEESLSDKDIELQDYRSMTDQEFQNAYKMSKTEWINKNKSLVIQNPSIKKALGLDEAVGQEYTVIIDRKGRERPVSGTIEELLGYFGYTLEVGKSYEHERGRYKINMNPRNINQLVDALNKAASNGAANGAPSTYYSVGEENVAEGYDARDAYELEDPKHPDFVKNYEAYKEKHPDAKLADFIAFLRSRKTKTNEGVPYKATNPHPASKDPIVAKVLKQMRPGLTGLDMNNEAFLYFAYEIGKMRAREMWEDYGPAIKYFYQSGIGVKEGWESGPEEYEEPYDDADDAYDRHRQEKIDAEAEAEWAKKPKKTTYKLTGRGPNMEPNYKFPGEYSSQEEADAARTKLMADPKTPHPEHIGIHKIERVVDEAVQGGGGVKNLEDYTAKRDYIYQQLADPKQADNYAYFRQALFDLNRLAKSAGIPIEESRAHRQLSTWFKNRELAQKYASGEVKIPTPQERKAELEKQKAEKEKVDEYGAVGSSGAMGSTPPGNPSVMQPQANTAATGSTVDPKATAAELQALTKVKSGLSDIGGPATASASVQQQKTALDKIKAGQIPNSAEAKALSGIAQGLDAAIDTNPNAVVNLAKAGFNQQKAKAAKPTP